MADAARPFTRHTDGALVRLRLTPKAGRNALGGIAVDAAGTAMLKALVTAVSEKGKANKALLKLLSKSWGVGMQRLTLIAGAKDRNKTVLVAGEPAETTALLENWLISQGKE
ncbi:MAG: DUF167 family protein [Rhodospirillaceae bacterium]